MKTRYIFVHGLGGWGSYDPIDRIIPEWGMLGGSLIKYLKKLYHQLKKLLKNQRKQKLLRL